VSNAASFLLSWKNTNTVFPNSRTREYQVGLVEANVCRNKARQIETAQFPSHPGIRFPQKEGRTVVFLDESGLSQRPHRCRTWSRRGHTPVLQYHFNWKTLSVIAGITLWNFYFRLYPGAIRTPQVVAFLKHLLRHIPGKLLLVWDRLPAHRSRVVQQFVASQ
jgi:hypothetical protein